MFVPKFKRLEVLYSMLNIVIFDIMKNNRQTQNVALSIDTHKMLVNYAQSVDGKITKLADRIIREFVQKELSKRVS